MSKQLSIFLDTNVLQIFFGTRSKKDGSNVFLNNLGISKDFYDLISFIEKNSLEEEIEICIPEVVVMEMKFHMINGFKNQKVILKELIEEHKKIFGDIAKLDSIEILYDDIQYENYIDSLIKDFFENKRNHAKEISFPRKEPIVDTLIHKALLGIKPFFSGKVEGKSHTDAGFKDSLIAETIYQYCNMNKKICIFITKDQDFSIEFSKKIQSDSTLILFNSIENAINALEEYYGTDIKRRLYKEFEENRYWHEIILKEADVELDESVSKIEVEDVVEDDTPNIFIVKIKFIVNETIYLFNIKFDVAANELINTDYRIEND